MLAFGFFFIALGYNPFSRQVARENDLSRADSDYTANEEKPRGLLQILYDLVFGDWGDKAALKEKEESGKEVIKRKKNKNDEKFCGQREKKRGGRGGKLTWVEGNLDGLRG